MFGSLKNWGRVSLVVGLVMLAGLLAACGGTENTASTDNNFVLPLYQGLNEVSALENDKNFTDKVLFNEKDYTDKKVRVFTTGDTLDAVKSYYSAQLTTLGWTDRSTAVVGKDTLGGNGWVLAFEKPAGNGTGRSRGLMMFNPTVNGGSDILKQYRDNGALPNSQNVLIVVDGLYAPGGTPSAPTATPKP